MSIYDNLPGKVSLSGKVRTIEEDLYGVDIDDPSRIRPYELPVPLQDAVQNFVPGVYIPVSEKGQANGVPTLDATGKVPAAQIPANPGNFLPLSGGYMGGDIDMDGNDIDNIYFVASDTVMTNNISSTRSEISVNNPLDMQNNKLINVATGTDTKDVATIKNINDHDTSPFAHSDIRNLIAAIQGTYVYVGKINLSTDSVTDTTLNNTVFAILSRTPLNGDVLVDNENGEWRFDGTNWVNLGHFDIAMASAFNDGLMSKEDYVKLSQLLNKGDFDTLIGTLATMDYLVNNYYNKAQSDVQVNALNGDIALRELLANKATDFSVVNDTKFPTTKAVSERLLNVPITELNNHTLKEVFEDGNIFNKTPLIYAGRGTLTLTGNQLVYTKNSNEIERFGYLIDNYLPNQKYYFNIDTISSTVDSFTFNLRSSNLDINRELLITNMQWLTVYKGYITPTYVGDVNQTFGFNIVGQIGETITFTNYYFIESENLGISSLTPAQMDYWFSVYQTLKVSDTNAIFSLIAQNKTVIDTKANISQEAWITPTLISATGTVQYMKDSLGFVHFKGTVTVPTGGTTNFMVMPNGYRISENTTFPIWDKIKNLSGDLLIQSNGALYIGSGTPGTSVTASITITYQGV